MPRFDTKRLLQMLGIGCGVACVFALYGSDYATGQRALIIAMLFFISAQLCRS
jgi:hypothetical protein